LIGLIGLLLPPPLWEMIHSMSSVLSSCLMGFALVAGLAGCGSSDGPAGFNVGGVSHCGTVLPCGGDVVGTWQVTTGCITAAGIAASQGNTNACPQASLSVIDISAIGTLVFGADLTYTMTAFSVQSTAQIITPASCVTGGTCADAAQSLLASSDFQSAACTGTTTCKCTAVQSPAVDTESGTYTLSGTTIVTRSSLAGTGRFDYCVQGSSLHLLADTSTGAGDAGPITVDNDTVAQKQ